MFLFTSLAYYQVRGLIGFGNTIPYINQNEYQDFIKKSGTKAIIFAEKDEDLDFIEQGYKSFKDYIEFRRASPSLAKEGQCISFPCVIGYKNSNEVAETGPIQPILFYDWAQNLSHPAIIELFHPELLRRIFNQPGAAIIGVDIRSRPDYLSPNENFYVTTSENFAVFDIKVSSGVYIYRSADHTILRADKNYKSYLKTSIVNPQKVNLKDKPFCGGFVLSGRKDLDSVEMEILRSLASTYKDIYFFPIVSGVATIFSEIGKIEYFPPPYFVLMNSSETRPLRYLIINSIQMHDLPFLKQYVRSILDGKQSYNMISDESGGDPNKLVYSDLRKTINEHDTDIVIVYGTYRMPRGEYYMAIPKAAESVIESKSFKFYYYNLSMNEMPTYFKSDYQPVVEFYAKGSKEPVTYKGQPYFRHFIDWVSSVASEKIVVKKYSPMEMQNSLPPIDASVGKIVYDSELWGIPGETEDPTQKQ